MSDTSTAWESEYQNPQMMSLDPAPQKTVLRFLKWLKKQQKKDHGEVIFPMQVLDLGCGIGRNSNYLAELGNDVIGYDVSETAIETARSRAPRDAAPTYEVRSIGQPYLLPDNSLDLILDITASNSLPESEREVYLQESERVLKPGGYMFVRALCLDGDKNAKNLLQDHPGSELGTYILPGLNITERVFSREEIVATYEPYFEILELKKLAGYARYQGRSYKRQYWLLYLRKK